MTPNPIYGIWVVSPSHVGWLKLGNGDIIHTPHFCVALAHLSLLDRDYWNPRIRRIDLWAMRELEELSMIYECQRCHEILWTAFEMPTNACPYCGGKLVVTEEA